MFSCKPVISAVVSSVSFSGSSLCFLSISEDNAGAHAPISSDADVPCQMIVAFVLHASWPVTSLMPDPSPSTHRRRGYHHVVTAHKCLRFHLFFVLSGFLNQILDHIRGQHSACLCCECSVANTLDSARSKTSDSAVPPGEQQFPYTALTTVKQVQAHVSPK